jgi:hypothetical protein
MNIKKTLKEILFSNPKRIFLQFLTSTILGLVFGVIGIPFKIYTSGMVSCMAIGCPEAQPPQLLEANLAANIVIWYLVNGILYRAYKRWRS